MCVWNLYKGLSVFVNHIAPVARKARSTATGAFATSLWGSRVVSVRGCSTRVVAGSSSQARSIRRRVVCSPLVEPRAVCFFVGCIVVIIF